MFFSDENCRIPPVFPLPIPRLSASPAILPPADQDPSGLIPGRPIDLSFRGGSNELMKSLIAAARGEIPADLLISNARVYNPFIREWEETSFSVFQGRVAGLGSSAAVEHVGNIVPGSKGRDKADDHAQYQG